MRIPLPAVALLILAGCATNLAPREFQDEKTAATITAVAKPWIFTAVNEQGTSNNHDFLNVHAIDVNRAGDHRQYFAVMQSFFAAGPDGDAAGPVLELQTPERTISLQPATQAPRQLGIAQPLEQPFALESRWWYFPVGKEDLAMLARAKNLHVALLMRDARVPYVVFRDGSAELTELSATLR